MLSKRLDAAVKQGHLTRSQADEILERLPDLIDHLGDAGPGGPARARFGPPPGDGEGFGPAAALAVAPLFFLGYIASELRRRRGRTFLTALGLGLGVGLVVTVAALSDGLDKAQDEVLEPLTGVGTDLSVTRPLRSTRSAAAAGRPGSTRQPVRSGAGSRRENGPVRQGLGDLGEPGEKFTDTNFTSGPQLSFAATRTAKVAGLDGVSDAAGGLTLSLVTVSGTVPEQTGQPQVFGAGPGGGRRRRRPARQHRLRREQRERRGPRPPRPRRRDGGPGDEGRLLLRRETSAR